MITDKFVFFFISTKIIACKNTGTCIGLFLKLFISVLALAEDDEERPSLQQRTTTTNPQIPSTQAMKMILEEDENPESPPAE